MTILNTSHSGYVAGDGVALTSSAHPRPRFLSIQWFRGLFLFHRLDERMLVSAVYNSETQRIEEKPHG